MTLAAQAWGHDGKTYAGTDMRELAALIGDRGDTLLSGIYNGFGVTAQTSPNTTVKVAAGRGLLKATTAGLFGSYSFWNDASINSTGFTATSTNGRKDFLILRITSGVPALEIVAGTAAGTPLEPTISGDNFIPLALITFPPSTTNITGAMIEDRRPFGGTWAQPWGALCAPVTGTSNVGGTTPSVAVIAQAPSVTLIEHRLVKIDYSTMLALTTGAGLLANLDLVRNGTVIQSWEHYISPGGVGGNESFGKHFVDVAPPAGATVYAIRWSANVTSAGVDVATTTYKRQMTVEDVGPASNPTP
jgi:hypothetical protein